MLNFTYIGNKRFWYPQIDKLTKTDTITGDAIAVTVYEDNAAPGIPRRISTRNVKYQKNKANCKTMSIKVSINKTGQQLLSNWGYVYNKAYNLARQYDIENPTKWTGDKDNWKNKVMKSLSEKFLVLSENVLKDKHSIALSISEYHKNKKSALTNRRRGNITHFTLRPKPLNNRMVVMEFEKTSCNKKNKIGQLVYGFKHLITRQFAVQFDRSTRTAHLLLRIPIEQLADINREYEPVSVDLGLRTFAACYDFSRYICVGNKNTKLDKLIDRANNKDVADFRSKKAERRYRRKRFTRIKHMVKDLHYKTAHFLCANYSEVYVGDFKSKKCKENAGNKAIKQRLNQYSFFKFKETLDYIATKYNTKVSRWNEYMSSRSCTWCGADNKKLGAAEIFKCPRCTRVTYRDCNAARNGMMRTLS